MPWFVNVEDEDGVEAVKGPFDNQEEAGEFEEATELSVSRGAYLAISKRSAESRLRSAGGRMGSDQPLPSLPEF